MSKMTPDEQNLWQYVEDESNELVCVLAENAKRDGYADASGVRDPELVALKVASATMVKMLAIMTERTQNTDLAEAYMQLVPLHVELIKVYSFRALQRDLER